MQELRIADIQVGGRHRKDMGDIDALAKSIGEIGLLQPVGVTPDNRLIFGERRLRAFQALGRETIPARTIDIARILDGEFAENELRKQFNVTERVAIMDAVEKEAGERRGGDRKSEEAKSKGKNLPFDPGVEAKKTRTKAAKQAGFGNHETASQAKKVVKNGSPALVSSSHPLPVRAMVAA